MSTAGPTSSPHTAAGPAATPNAPTSSRRRLLRNVPLFSLGLSLLAAVQFARGVIGVENPTFVGACVVSAITLLLWFTHLAYAPPLVGADGASSGRPPPSPSEQAIVAVVLGAAGFLGMELVARSGGAGNPLAVTLLCVALAVGGALAAVASRNTWQRRTLAGLAATLGLANATYPRQTLGPQVGASTGQNVEPLIGAVAQVSLAILVAVSLSATSAADNRLVDLSGEWEVSGLALVREENLANPGDLDPERWALSRRPGCNEFECSYTVERSNGGGGFSLRTTTLNTWEGVRLGQANCVEAEPTYRLVRRNGYDTASQIQFALNGRSTLEVTVRADEEWTVNDSGKDAGCSPTGSATYVGTADSVGAGKTNSSRTGSSATTPAAGSTTQGSAGPGPVDTRGNANRERAARRNAGARISSRQLVRRLNAEASRFTSLWRRFRSAGYPEDQETRRLRRAVARQFVLNRRRARNAGTGRDDKVVRERARRFIRRAQRQRRVWERALRSGATYYFCDDGIKSAPATPQLCP